MSLQYQRMSDDNSFSNSSPEFPHSSELSFMQIGNRHVVRRPLVIGIMQIVLGILISFLGLLETFILPMMDDNTGSMKFDKPTCYGAGLYAGLVMVLAGSVAVRASMCKRKTAMRKFYNVTCLALLVYVALTLALIVAYYKGWNGQDIYPAGSHRAQVHLVVVVTMGVGVTLALSSLLLFYDLVCCGEGQLWHWWSHCLCDIFCAATQSQKSRSPESELNGQSTPVSLMI